MKTATLNVAVAALLLTASSMLAAEQKPAKSPPKPAAKPAGKEAAKAPARTPGAPATPPAPAPVVELPASVATVEGQGSKREELEEAFKAMAERQGVPAEAIPEEQRTQVYRMLLDNLIVSKLIDKRAKDFPVKDEE